jgi:small-conductance mechanosensitive channel
VKAGLDAAIARVRLALFWLPDWVSAVIILLVLTALALAAHALALRLLRRSRLARRRGVRLAIDRGAGPSRAAFIVFGMGAALPALGLSSEATHALLRLDFAAFLLLLGWTGIELTSLMGDLYLARLPQGFEQDALARKHVTQIRVLRRTAQVTLGVLSVAAALMAQPGVRQYGVSLFASAGAAGIVLGLAARPVLSNLLAGVQIALTQPIKVEDAVVVEGEWGWIEDITSTYVVIRIWDLRRLVVPLSRFLEQPFQNWTRESSSLIGSVHLFVDYGAPVDEIRRELDRIVRQSRLWDGKVVNLQVVEATDRALQLRALVSARNSSDAWDLRCEVREKLIAYLQRSLPHMLPRLRLDAAPPLAAGDKPVEAPARLARKAGG